MNGSQNTINFHDADAADHVASPRREAIQVIDHYELVEVVGHGGMGTVYKAIDLQLQRPVALKLMHPHLASKPDFQARFLAECRAASALDHPNIIRVYDVALRENQLYMVMEYVEGETARKWLNAYAVNNTFLDLQEIVTVVRQVAQALHYAHSQGIIHRDVKPDNVLIRSKTSTSTPIMELRAVLTDFGLAKRIDNTGTITPTAELLGTLAYMAPEQFRDLPLDGRCDIYSLGVMLYELVTGRQPFSSTSPMDVILMHTQGEPERVLDLRPDTPPSLESIIHRAMLKNPDERYDTAGEVARELEALEKSIKPLTEAVTYRRKPAATDQGPKTVFDILPALDRPAIPVDLFSEGTDDVIIVTPLDGPSWSLPFERPSIIVGRDVACDLRLDDPTVSRQHVRIDRLPDGQISVADVGSLNGVFMGDDKIERNMMRSWPTAQSVKVGPFWLTLRLAKNSAGQARRMALSAPRTIETKMDERDVVVHMTPADAIVEPGSAINVRVEITNNADDTQSFVLGVQGMSAEWFTTAPFPVQVQPHKSAERLVAFHPPRIPTSAAASYDYRLSVAPPNQERSQIGLIGTLNVLPYFAFDSTVEVNARGAHIHITNQGNSQRSYVVELREHQNVLLMLPSRTKSVIGAGQSAVIDIRIVPKRRPIFGTARRYPVEVFIRTDGMRPQTRPFDVGIRPMIPWELAILLLVTIIGLAFVLIRGLTG